MGKSFGGVDIGEVLAEELGDDFDDATLTHVEPGERDPDNPTAGTQPSESNYECKALVLDYAERFRLAGLVRVGERKVLILGATLPEGVTPRGGDRVTIEDQEFTVAREGGVARDPAGATWELRVTQS